MMEITAIPAYRLKELYKKKELTVPQVTKAYLEKIKAEDSKIGAFITLCEEEALQRAEEIQKAYDEGKELGALAGVPIAIKDNICTKGTKTTCASKMLENFIAPYDATVMQQIQDAGMIVLGKTNMDEFAMGGSTEHSAFGKTHNPVNLKKVPGGSSGGSAAAVAADFAPIALGSDTGGSIRQPASFCGVIGLKPTYGLVSRYGLVAFASSLDQIGPMANNVTDIALTLNVIAGHDAMDSTSAKMEKEDYTKALKNDVKGLRIGIPEEFLGEGVEEEVKAAIQKAAKRYEELGATVTYCSMPDTKYALPAYYIIACAEASANLGRFDGIRYGYRTQNFENLQDIYRNSRSEGFGEEVKRRILLGTYVLSSGYYDAYYKKAQKVRTVIKNGFDKAFETVDVLLTPTAPTVAFDLDSKSNDPLQMYMADILTVSVNVAGLPAISIPCGTNQEGMPIGMQLIGKHFEESKLLQVAYTYEQNENKEEEV